MAAHRQPPGSTSANIAAEAKIDFAHISVDDLQTWVAALPKANVNETGKRLYYGIVELYQTPLTAGMCFEYVEILRPSIYFAVSELAKRYLNKPIVLPEYERKAAVLAQQLQRYLTKVYQKIAGHLLASVCEKTSTLTAKACHRALTSLGECIFSACQLYMQSPVRLWSDLHQLYYRITQKKVYQINVDDEQAPFYQDSNCYHVYRRILLLGCSRPFQLRQQDIAVVYNLFDRWAGLTKLVPSSDEHAIFVINVRLDTPPYYRDLQKSSARQSLVGFDTSALTGRLSDCFNGTKADDLSAAENPVSTVLPGADTVSASVLAILLHNLSAMTARTANRTACVGSLQLGLGLSSVHYLCSGGNEFSRYLHNSTRNKSGRSSGDTNHGGVLSFDHYLQNPQTDVWGSSFDSRHTDDNKVEGVLGFNAIDFVEQSTQLSRTESKDHQYSDVRLVNMSAGGYCARWGGEAPATLRAGELLTLREDASEPWRIGVIRWLRQDKQQVTQFGIEVLAMRVEACTVQLIHKIGDPGDIMRALLLSGNTRQEQTTTLITPPMPFVENNKVLLGDGSDTIKVQLIKKLSGTHSYSQFDVRQLQRMDKIDALHS